MNGRAVLAVGGNALIRDERHQTVEDQYQAAGEATSHITEMIQRGWEVAVTHGNGPQVGFILRRSELAAAELHEVPLDVCGADSQGAIGYALQQNLLNDFQECGIRKTVATLITQTEVRADDPAFTHPSKTIGSFMTEEVARQRRDKDGWEVVEDAGRGWRRVVPSPVPRRIVEAKAIQALLAAGVVTITTGGGGIPVVADEKGRLRGVAAVIDKDLAAALLANAIGADLLIISTAVEKVALNWSCPDQSWIDQMTLAQARRYLAEGVHFEAGSMAPKIQAVINYLEGGGRRVIITNPANIQRALDGKTGTHILP
ncbi:MAG: carbamate kinase [Acidobacteriota bacterium]